MPFAAALSTVADSEQALGEVCARAQERLGSAPDLALLFYSPHHIRAVHDLARAAQAALSPGCLMGCPGETVVGEGREVEQAPAMSLWLAKWPDGVQMTPFKLYLQQTSEGISLLGWPEALVTSAPAESVILLLADPFTFPVDVFLDNINEAYPGLRVVGGMASGVRGPGECRMIQKGKPVDQGAVGLLLEGPVGARPVVSQGCRPVGRHLVITRAEGNVIHELGGKPALAQIQEVWQALGPEDQELMQQGFHIGKVINEYRGDFQRGDFLIRNVLKVRQDTGAVVVNDKVRVGQTVQFHVRDAASADEDLHALLQLDLAAHEKPPAAALLFSCNGRGTRMFGGPDHDAAAVAAEAGPVPVAGFFAQGELGPVGGENFIHGYTASVVLFEE